MKYLLIKNTDGRHIEIVEDPVELFRSGKFNEKTDRLFQIGPEVKIKISIEQTTIYRNHSTIEDNSKSRTRNDQLMKITYLDNQEVSKIDI